MAILYDPEEARDRRLRLLLDTATNAMQIQQNQQKIGLEERQVGLQEKELGLKDPNLNKYLRGELASQNRSRMADARYKEALITGGMGKMSPSRMNAKDKRTEEVITTFHTNAMNREVISDVTQSLKNLTSGVYGKVGRGFAKNLAADSPALGDYQKVKSFLTDVTLGKVKFTKGAVSDADMQLFKEASANDELLSSPRVLAVIEKAMKGYDNEESSLAASYKKLYGEDPREWDEIKGIKTSSVVKSFATDTGIPQDVLAQIQGTGKIKAIRKKEKK